jgi:hypothetical protein
LSTLPPGSTSANTWSIRAWSAARPETVTHVSGRNGPCNDWLAALDGSATPSRNEPDIRELIVRSYRVVYRLRSGVAEIVTVFRGSREFADRI